MTTNLSRLAAGFIVMLTAASAFAADTAASAANGSQARYQAEKSRCLNGKSGQDESTCVKEAAAAKMTHDGQLTDPDPKNATKRCDVLAGDEKRDCLARASGKSATTSSSGSVKAGGIIRETVTTTAAPPAAPASR